MSSVSTLREFAIGIVRTLQSHGHTAYFAGGCVRDQLLGREPKDFDVATSARPEAVLELFPRSQKVGVSFGVVLVRGKKCQVEVATFRTDGSYLDGRHPETVTFSTPEEDATRRDFTCNGIFYDPVADAVHDFVGGRADIQTQTLRAIGEPEHRFAEDQLRLLRAVRFCARLGFELEPVTAAAIGKLAAKIKTISRERIGEELRGMMEHPARAQAAALLQELGLLAEIWPVDLVQPADMPAKWERLSRLPDAIPRHTALLALQLDLDARTGAHADPAEASTDYWSFAIARLREAFVLSNQESDDMVFIAARLGALRRWESIRAAQFKRLLADERWPQVNALVHAAIGEYDVAALDAKVAALQAEGVAPAAFVTGVDLIALGASPGRQFKAWLDELYDRQLEREFADRDTALNAARRLIAGV